MSYKINIEEKNVEIVVEGEFDAILASELQMDLEKLGKKQFDSVVFNLKGTTMIASSGIRILIFAEERLALVGGVTVRNASGIVMDILKLSGIDDFMNIE